MSKSTLAIALFIPFCLSTVACANIETGEYDDTIEFVGEDSQALSIANAAGDDGVDDEEGEITETNYQFCYRSCCVQFAGQVCNDAHEITTCHNQCTNVPIEKGEKKALAL